MNAVFLEKGQELCQMVGELKETSEVYVHCYSILQAAKYYELASKWGHATAMYNLGVFCVHGWGGVPVDCNRARQLFVAAAKLGQTNAQEALSMVPPASDDSMGNFNMLFKFREPIYPILNQLNPFSQVLKNLFL
jgi:TPR repeat protein